MESTNADHAEASWVLPDRSQALIIHVAGRDAATCQRSAPRALHGSLLEAVLSEGEEIIGEPGEGDPHAGTFRSCLGAPVYGPEGVQGAVELYAHRSEAFSDMSASAASRAVRSLGSQLASASDLEVLPSEDALQTRIRELEADNRRLRRNEEQAAQSLRTVSHELNTQLASMTGFTALLLQNSEENLSERQLQWLGIMERSGQIMERLLTDALRRDEDQQEAISLQPSELSLSELCHEVVQTFAPRLEERSQELRTELSPRTLRVHADRDRLMQVLSNLVTNASKYSPAGTPIDLRFDLDEGDLRVSVIDRGIGIAKSDQRRLFRSPFRARNHITRSVAGSGLGLFICRAIIEQHGGRISVNSTPGQGTEVTFWVPRRGSPESVSESMPN